MQNPTNCTSAKSYSKGNRTHNFIQSTSPIPRYTWKKKTITWNQHYTHLHHDEIFHNLKEQEMGLVNRGQRKFQFPPSGLLEQKEKWSVMKKIEVIMTLMLMISPKNKIIMAFQCNLWKDNMPSPPQNILKFTLNHK